MSSNKHAPPQITETVIGFVDVPISEEEQPQLEDTFIGGTPLWPHPDSPPPKELLLCKNCNSPMHLLLQCGASLENTLYDRILYLFGCAKPGCRRQKGSVRAIRALNKDPELISKRQKELDDYAEEQEKKAKAVEEKKNKLQQLSNQLFDTNTPAANPFAQQSASNPFASQSSSNPFSTEEPVAEKSSYAEIAKPSEPLKPKQPNPSKLDFTLPAYPGYILYLDSEELDPKKQQLPPLPDSIQPEQSETPPSASNLPKISTDSNEGDELVKMVDDPTFQNFANIISYNVSQVLRYHLDGTPLLYSSKDDVANLFFDSNGNIRPEPLIPNPPFSPSSKRRFELQLMPKAIIDLESDLDNILDGMEWGTIIVATDEKDFIPEHLFDANHVGYVEEWCGVQWEELVKNN